MLAVALASSLAPPTFPGVPAGPSRELDPDTAANRALVDRVQRATFRYFWDGADPASGMALEGSGSPQGHAPNVVTVGGSGFGVAAIVVATSRGWVARPAAVERLLRITRFLALAHEVNDPEGHQGYHGAWSHWLDTDPRRFARTIPFSEADDGGDIVETADMIQGLLLAQTYFDGDGPDEAHLRREIQRLWEGVDWRWYASAGDGLLRWHWSPTGGFWRPADAVGRGWNEALNVYVLGAAAPDPAKRIGREVYEATFVDPSFGEPREVEGYDVRLPLAGGGPLFFAHYAFIGLDPRFMRDATGDYWRHNVTHTLVNRAYALYSAPAEYGYGEDVWGLTASQGPPAASDPPGSRAYAAWAPPPGPDSGTIAPTAALSSFPYTPWYSMQVLRWLDAKADRRLGAGPYGFYDAVNPSKGWVSGEYLAIDQGPIVCMIENYRTGLLWRLFAERADVAAGLVRLGIERPRHRTGFYLAVPEARSGAVDLMKHVDGGAYRLDVAIDQPGAYTLSLDRPDGSTALVPWRDRPMAAGETIAELEGLPAGRYRAHLRGPDGDAALDVVLH